MNARAHATRAPVADILTRKDEHLDIVLDGRAASRAPLHPFDAYRFRHHAFPSYALSDIDLTTELLGRTLNAPFLISSMTGGPKRADRINRALAEAAQAERVAFAVGSQRVALEQRGAGGLASTLRDIASDVPLLANIGAAQVALWNDPARSLAAVEMLQADALIIHLNPLQEALQPGGDTNWGDLPAALEALCAASPVPVIAKEVGSGISGAVARQLVDLGVTAIDVAGTGGTSWAAVEAERAHDPEWRALAAPFHDWGLSTPDAISDVRTALPDTTLIASGGIRHGLDAALAIRLGADLVGQAAHLLSAALNGAEAAAAAIAGIKHQMRIVCFCTNAPSLDALRAAELMPTAPR